MLLLPRDLERAAYLVYGIERDAGLQRLLARDIDTDGSASAALQAAVVLGNPGAEARLAFERAIAGVWRRLVPGASLILGARTRFGCLLHARTGVMTDRQVKLAATRLGAPLCRTWQAYPSLERPTILAVTRTGRDLRALALEQAGVRRWLPTLVAGFGVAPPALLWEFRK